MKMNRRIESQINKRDFPANRDKDKNIYETNSREFAVIVMKYGKSSIRRSKGYRRHRSGGTSIRRSRFPGRRRRLTLPVKGARARLRWFRQASVLAVALTGILLLLFSPGEADLPPGDGINQSRIEPSGQETAEEAIGTIRQL